MQRFLSLALSVAVVTGCAGAPTGADASLTDEALAESATRHARAMANAFAAKDFATFVTYLPDSLLVRAGGADAVIRKMKADLADARIRSDVEGSTILSRNEVVFALTKSTDDINGSVRPSLMLGRSGDKGATWRFIAVTSQALASLSAIFPDAPDDLPGRIAPFAPEILGELQQQMRTAELKKARVDVKAISNAVQMFKMLRGELPQNLAVLAEKSERGEALIELVPADPWGAEYALVVRGPRDWEVVSKGPDGQLDTDDDISSSAIAQ